MGCDIHGTVEKKVGDRWVMVDRLHYSHPTTRRNYERFAALAGVRGDGPEPKGIPPDVSESTKLYIEEWGVDGHTHSFLDLVDAARLFLNTDHLGKEIGKYEKEYPISHYFDVDEANPGEYRLVFWFDN